MKNILLCSLFFFIAHTGFSQTLSLVKNFNPDGGLYDTYTFQHLGDKMGFIANDGIHGHEYWVTDGTPAGTYAITNFPEADGFINGFSSVVVIVNDKALFFHNDTLYATDGLAAGPTLLMDYLPDYTEGTTGFATVIPYSYNGKVYYLIGDNDHEQDLYLSDGTAAGTQLIHNTPGGSDASNFLGVVNNKLMINYRVPEIPDSEELFRITLASSEPHLVKDIYPGDNGSWPQKPFSAGTALFFEADHPTFGREVWITNGTAAGTVMLGDINEGVGINNTDPVYETIFNDELFFWGRSNVYGYELYHAPLDGSPAVLLKDINPGISNAFDGPVMNQPNLAQLNDILLFKAISSGTGEEIWRTDGTPEGTFLLKDIRPGANGSDPQYFYVRDSLLYFQADNGPADHEYWVSDGTAGGTFLLKDIDPGTGGVEGNGGISFPAKGTIFQEETTSNGEEWWVTDGTSEGTALLKDINPGLGSAVISLLPVQSVFNNYTFEADVESFNAYNGITYFLADNGSSIRQLWQTDGSACGTYMIADVLPDGASSGALYEYGEKLLLDLSTDEGASLWVVEDLAPPLTATITPDGPVTFCKGGNVVLQANSETGYTFQWYKNGTPIAGATESNRLVNKSGNYSVVVTSPQGCVETSAIVTVTILPRPNASINNLDVTNNLCVDPSIKLKANSGAGYIYQWYVDSIPIAGATSQIYIATTPGNYSVKVTNPEGCMKISLTYAIIHPCRLMDDVSIKIFPNPASQSITISFDETLNDELQISISDMAGNSVLQNSYYSGDGKVLIDISHLAPGCYMLETVAGGTAFSTQLIKL